jgi:GDSL-like lipase/acylhydrolase family protein
VKTLAAIALLFTSVSLEAQSAPQVVITGNSIAQYEYSLQTDIFPSLPANDVFITGHPGYTCAQVELALVFDVFGNSYEPRNPEVAVLIDTTNDWEHNTSPPVLMSCLIQSIQALLNVKSRLQIVVLTTPPYVQHTPGCSDPGDKRALIESYNALMPSLATEFPNNVTVLDAFTPFELGDTGWADPAKMTGPCGIHPGPAYTWSGGQPILAAIYNSVVMGFLQTP